MCALHTIHHRPRDSHTELEQETQNLQSCSDENQQTVSEHLPVLLLQEKEMVSELSGYVDTWPRLSAVLVLMMFHTPDKMMKRHDRIFTDERNV